MARRFFVPQRIEGASVLITGPDVRHIKSVLRLLPGDGIEVVDPSGVVYLVELVAIDGDKVVSEIKGQLGASEEEKRITLFQGLPKGSKKMDAVVRGAVEVGADRIVPVITDRSVPELDTGKAAKRTERWSRIAREASKQAKRAQVVEVYAPVDFTEAVRMFADHDAMIVFWEEEKERLVEHAVGPEVVSVGVFVGPEGGLSASEVETLRQAGAVTVTLGRSILRTETAGVVACALVRYELLRREKRHTSEDKG